MKTRRLNWFKVLAFGCAMAMLASCDDDSSEPMGKGDVAIEITDAPTDDANVEGVFVTVTDLKIDGQSVSGFEKQTINLKAYQEGETRLLFEGQQLDAKTYGNLTLVLDLEADADGNAPGCYVLTTDEAKYKLKETATGTTEVTVDKDWQIAADATTRLVIDFDLRKSLAYSDDPQIRYRFVSDDNLRAALRLVAKNNAGTIHGMYMESGIVNADKIIVYAYKKGTFDASIETEAQGENDLYFANAVTSAEVNSGITDKTYTLALLEGGEYELHFAAHTEGTDGKMMFDTMLDSETSVNGSVSDMVTVEAGVTVDVSSVIAIEP